MLFVMELSNCFLKRNIVSSKVVLVLEDVLVMGHFNNENHYLGITLFLYFNYVTTPRSA